MRIRYNGRLMRTVAAVSIGIALGSCHAAYFERIVEKKPIQYTVYGNGQVSRSESGSGKAKRIVLKAEAGAGWMFKQWQGVQEKDKYEREIEVKEGKQKEIAAEFVRRKWTYVLYMAADNELEGWAMEAVNEVEAVDWRGKDVSVLVLLDRTAGHDATDGDWSGTRLYEIRYDKDGVNSTFISQRLECAVLGLKKDDESELDMSKSRTVQGLLEYARSQYQAEQYGLIVWGHGTGWRGMLKDETSSGSAMKVGELAEAVKDKGLSIIGFDTGFAGNLEVLYELKDAGRYGIGSSGAGAAGGWQYRNVFGKFLESSESAEAFCSAAVEAYKEKYGGTAGADITVCKLDKMQRVFDAYERFSQQVSDVIRSKAVADTVKEVLLKESRVYRLSEYPTDVYTDVKDSARKLKEKAGELTADAVERQQIEQAADEVQRSVEESSVGWIQGQGDEGHIGLFVIQMQTQTAETGAHDAGYVKGSGAQGQCAVVKESMWWAVQPGKIKSILDKLFYVYR